MRDRPNFDWLAKASYGQNSVLNTYTNQDWP